MNTTFQDHSLDTPPGTAVPTPSDPQAKADQLQRLPCIHCGEPTVCHAQQQPEDVFCCAGCRGAYQLIGGLGLQDFYALRERSSKLGAARPAAQDSHYDRFDNLDFLGPSAPQQTPDGTWVSELAISGLHCSACAWLIENALTQEAGLIDVKINLGRHSIRVHFDSSAIQLSRIARLLDALGYQISPFDPSTSEHVEREHRQHLVRIAAAGFCAANAMWIAIALYAGASSGVAGYDYFLTLVGTALSLAAVLGPGRTFFVGALAAVRTGTPHMDLPVALGLSVGSVVGTVNAIRGSGDVYFDSLTALVFLLLVGRWIQFRQQRRAAQAVDLMLRLTPHAAELVEADGSTRTVAASSLTAGQIVQVAPNDAFPADGVIQHGTTHVDRALLTGESKPMHATVGDDVEAGTINLTAPVRLAVSTVGQETRLGGILKTVESAIAQKTPVVLLANRIGGYFVVTILALAVATFLGWWPHDMNMATSCATTLLIVACPCALALATPLAIGVGVGRAAQRSILIRDGSSLEQLARPGRLWLDKTGTLTEGRQRVTSVSGSPAAIRLAAGLEACCVHPIADALVQYAHLEHMSVPDDGTLERAVYGGVIGSVEGQRVEIGNLEFMQAAGADMPATLEAAHATCLANNESPVIVAIDGRVAAVVGIQDPIRQEAIQVLNSLRDSGWQLGLLSGDHPEIVQRIGAQLDLPAGVCHGGLSPLEKLEVIQRSKQESRNVVMVGDGANDAAALAASDVGIAMHGGAELSLQAAPVFVATGNLRSLLSLMTGASRTQRLIWATFAIALTYNLVAVVLAMLGWIGPLFAAILMPISSLSVLAITLGVPTFRSQA